MLAFCAKVAFYRNQFETNKNSLKMFQLFLVIQKYELQKVGAGPSVRGMGGARIDANLFQGILTLRHTNTNSEVENAS